LKDSNNATGTFAVMRYEAKEQDIEDALDWYAENSTEEVSCSVYAAIGRCLTLDFTSKRLPEYFSITWGTTEADMQRVATRLLREKKLQPYKSEAES
jgi:hypothetical protein